MWVDITRRFEIGDERVYDCHLSGGGNPPDPQ